MLGVAARCGVQAAARQLRSPTVQRLPANLFSRPACMPRFGLRFKSSAVVAEMPSAIIGEAAEAVSAKSKVAAEKVGEVLIEGALVKAGYERVVGWWLVGTSGMLLSMIAIGGYTRLSGSGLSMTDWRIQGRSLPRTEEAWVKEFEEYKLYPEYQRLHFGTMELSEFKRIYFVEWFHRMWGRTAGCLFAAPLAYFAAKGVLKAKFGLGLTGLLGLGFSQAFVGWWMVRSGFDPPEKHTPTLGTNQRPRVSPYRLASHWTAALTLYVGCVWSAMCLLRPSPAAIHTTAKAIAAAAQVRRLAIPVAGAVGITLLSGPFVAGNDAGHAYNTWPKMIDDWVPPEWLSAVSEPMQKWRLFFEDTAVVQFNHRTLAYGSVVSALALSAYSTCLPLAPAAASAVRLLPIAIAGQVCLGIATLLLYVPIELGVAHQFGGVAVLTTMLLVLNTLRLPPAAAVAALA